MNEKLELTQFRHTDDLGHLHNGNQTEEFSTNAISAAQFVNGLDSNDSLLLEPTVPLNSSQMITVVPIDKEAPSSDKYINAICPSFQNYYLLTIIFSNLII
jgi:hypothetical protein